MKSVGVMVGRFCPLHLGHCLTINTMINNHGKENCLLLIGSANSERTFKTPLNYTERRELVQNMFNIKLAPIADQKEDITWNISLIDLIDIAFDFHNSEINLYCGDQKDIERFNTIGFKIQNLNRYQNNISATYIRDIVFRHIEIGDISQYSLEEELRMYIPEKNLKLTIDYLIDALFEII